MQTYLFFTLLWIAAAYRWGDWRGWRKYYPTFLFLWFGDLLYFALFYQHPLWLYYLPGMSHLVSGLLVSLIHYPLLLILYLSSFPHTFGKQLVYVFLWINLSTVLEWIIIRQGIFLHFNGWSIWWSYAFNMFMIPTFRLHQNNPLLALCILIGGLVSLLFLFDVPLELIK